MNKNILLLSYDVSPYQGSEASTGWNYIINMMRDNRLTVLFGKREADINKYLADNEMPCVKFVHVPDTIKPSKISKDISYYFQYKQWHKNAYLKAKEIIDTENIDIVHFLNPTGFKDPGYLWKLDRPYIWGPIAAVHNYPLALYKPLSTVEKLKAFFYRRLVHNFLFNFDPQVRKAIKRSTLIGASTPQTHKSLMSVHHRESFFLPENGITNIERSTPIEFKEGAKLEIVALGSLCVRKNVILILEALKLLRNNYHDKLLLHIVGSGNLMEQLKRYAADNQLNDMITWHGQVSRNDAQRILSNSHLLIITSLSEGTPTTIWEAMSKGVPIITLDHCGMSGFVYAKNAA